MDVYLLPVFPKANNSHNYTPLRKSLSKYLKYKYIANSIIHCDPNAVCLNARSIKIGENPKRKMPMVEYAIFCVFR